jgi:hypothetical protein
MNEQKINMLNRSEAKRWNPQPNSYNFSTQIEQINTDNKMYIATELLRRLGIPPLSSVLIESEWRRVARNDDNMLQITTEAKVPFRGFRGKHLNY